MIFRYINFVQKLNRSVCFCDRWMFRYFKLAANIYSFLQSHETKQNEHIYDFLHNPEVQALEKNVMDTYRKRTEKTSKRRSALNSEGNATINGGAISFNQKFLNSKVGIWENIIDMRTSLQNMLREYVIPLSMES